MGQQQVNWDFDRLLPYLDQLHRSDIAAAKRDLAVKALAAFDKARQDFKQFHGIGVCADTADDLRNALERLFTAEGIELTTSQQGERER